MKILIIRFSSIGDIVMTTPVIRCISKQLNAEVHFATKKSFSSIVGESPYINKIIELDKDWASFIAQLKAVKYDIIVDLHNNLRSRRVALALGIKSRKFNKLNIHKQALIRFRINNLPNLHVAERGLDTVKDLGVVNDHEGMDLFLPAGLKLADEIAKREFICVALATAHATKNIPVETLIALCRKSLLPVVLLGGPSDREIGEQIRNSIENEVINMAGEISLLESALYIEQSKFLIAGDTGLLHMAAALKKPTISIWGATIPEYGVFPYYGKYDIPHSIHEVKLDCRPCSKHGGKSCPKKHFNCMNLQDRVEILKSMNNLFAIS